MKLSELVNKGLALVLEKGDKEVITAQKDPETADYTYGVVSDIVDYGDGTVGLVGGLENTHERLTEDQEKLHAELKTRIHVDLAFMSMAGCTSDEHYDMMALLAIVARDKLFALTDDRFAFMLYMEKKYLPGGEYRPVNFDEWKNDTGLANPGVPIVTDEIKRRLNRTFGVINHESSQR